MSWVLHSRAMAAVAALFAVTAAWPQWSFQLDTAFRTDILQQNVNSILLLPDGKLIASGIMRFPGEFSDKRLVRLLPDGTRDETFYNSGLGRGDSSHGSMRNSMWDQARFEEYYQPATGILPSSV